MAAGAECEPRPRVLIVDGDLPGAEQVIRGLDEDGFPLHHVSKADDVVEAARSFRPHVVLIELLLGTHAGIEVAQDLRDAGMDGLPLVAMSASHYMREIAEESGLFRAEIEKPFDIEDVEVVLCEAVRQPAGA